MLYYTVMDSINYKQLPDESQAAYAAFCEYRDCHPIERSISLVEERLGRSVGHWARQYSWNQRVEGWDEHIDAGKRARRAQEFEEREIEQFEGLANLQILTLANIEGWQEVMLADSEDTKIPIMSLKEARHSMESLVKLYRLMNSESTEIQETKNSDSGKDFSKLSVEELVQLKEMTQKLKE